MILGRVYMVVGGRLLFLCILEEESLWIYSGWVLYVCILCAGYGTGMLAWVAHASLLLFRNRNGLLETCIGCVRIWVSVRILCSEAVISS